MIILDHRGRQTGVLPAVPELPSKDFQRSVVFFEGELFTLQANGLHVSRLSPSGMFTESIPDARGGITALGAANGELYAGDTKGDVFIRKGPGEWTPLDAPILDESVESILPLPDGLLVMYRFVAAQYRNHGGWCANMEVQLGIPRAATRVGSGYLFVSVFSTSGGFTTEASFVELNLPL
ncbi:MAG: hypothetical protein U1E65_21845 [Myxococcota bacterium]